MPALAMTMIQIPLGTRSRVAFPRLPAEHSRRDARIIWALAVAGGMLVAVLSTFSAVIAPIPSTPRTLSWCFAALAVLSVGGGLAHLRRRLRGDLEPTDYEAIGIDRSLAAVMLGLDPVLFERSVTRSTGRFWTGAVVASFNLPFAARALTMDPARLADLSPITSLATRFVIPFLVGGGVVALMVAWGRIRRDLGQLDAVERWIAAQIEARAATTDD